MLMTIKRIGYYAFFSISGLFFLTQLTLGSDSSRLSERGLINSTALLVMFIVLYISKMDKAYLIQSIPLRVIGGTTSLLGLILVVISMRL
jgi:hypothetical protein